MEDNSKRDNSLTSDSKPGALRLSDLPKLELPKELSSSDSRPPVAPPPLPPAPPPAAAAPKRPAPPLPVVAPPLPAAAAAQRPTSPPGSGAQASSAPPPVPPPLPGAATKTSTPVGTPVAASNVPPPPAPSTPSVIAIASAAPPAPVAAAATPAAPPASTPAATSAPPPQPTLAQLKPAQQEAPDPESAGESLPATSSDRRSAKRRPAGPSRDRIAANDDAPSIGGLIYALNQQPSRKPFGYAMGASAAWTVFAAAFLWLVMLPQLPAGSSAVGIFGHPWFLSVLATWLGPIALFWFLAMLAWRSEELHLRSTAMTEVAVRLAEPDRMAEQSTASLGQAVRRQVSFMNDAVSRALGRAGELEALVHREVSSLEQSYEDNERKIRALINELSGERNALLNTGQRFQQTLQHLGQDVPALIEKLNAQQLTLARIIEGASENLTALETAIGSKTERLESTVSERTHHLHRVLEDYTSSLSQTLGSQSDNMQSMLGDYTAALGMAFDSRTQQMKGLLESGSDAIAGQLATHNRFLSQKTNEISVQLKAQQANLEAAINDRTEMLQSVFEEYARALDTTLAHRAQALDTQLVERTKALDDAFSDRLRLFDEAILRSTMAIDSSVGENARALTVAMESHAEQLGQTLNQEARRIDHTLMQGIEAVRSTSENISQQSLRAIEGLAGQADLLRSVSENIFGQINSVTNRFETQGQAILRSANALESANLKIDRALQQRNEDLGRTLDRMSGKAEELGRAIEGYSTNLEGSLASAEQRARMLTDELSRGAQEHSRATLEGIERLKMEASREADRALADLRNEFANVSREISERLGVLGTEFSQTTGEVRQQAARAVQQLEAEQQRLRQQLDLLPNATQETSAAMRRALQDQLGALDRLTELATRTTERNNSRAPGPAREPRPLTSLPAASTAQPARDTATAQPQHRQPAAASQPADDEGHAQATGSRPRNLTNLTTTLARELSARQARLGRGDGTTPPAATEPGDRWSLGDLLARASEDDGGGRGAPRRPSAPQAADSSAMLDLTALAGALDAATASVIWSRFRNGQRGFMVRSIYAPESRKLFDTVERRYRDEPAFRANVDRFLVEFERGLHEFDQKDPTRQSSDAQITTDTGRVYIVLAHAAGRLH